MAIEYVYYGAAELDTSVLRSRVAGAVDGAVAPDGTVVRDGLMAMAYRVTPGDEATAAGLFEFPHRITVRFRFSATRPELEEHNTALMVGAVLALAEADGVLLFNGEEAVLRTVGGEVTFGAGWVDWDDMAEVVALRADRPVALLAQPLL